MESPQPTSETAPSFAGPSLLWRRLFQFGSVLLAAACAYYAWSADVRTPLHVVLGLTILVLSCLPALRWARQGQMTLPVFETFMMTGLNTYALPLLNGHQVLALYSIDDVTRSALAVVVFQLSAVLVYSGARARPSSHRFWQEPVISDRLSRWISYGIAINTVYVLLSTFTSVIPERFESVLRAVCFGLGIICTFITSRRLGHGELTSAERAFFFINIFLQCVGAAVTLFLVGAVSLLLLSLLGYISASGRIPLVVTIVLLGILAVLHHGKAAMREKYWTDTEKTVPTVAQVPAFFTEWFGYGFTTSEDTGSQRMTAKLIERTSLMQMVCLVASATPAQQPYLYGETYRDIPAQFVPRLLWPDKPLGHVSTSRLSIYYGLQSEEDTEKTTIGFGVVAEAYANFGFAGLVAVGAAIGLAIKLVQSWAFGGPLLSYGGLVLIILLAWSFQVEFTVSIWLASFYQACIAVLGIPFLLKQLFG